MGGRTSVMFNIAVTSVRLALIDAQMAVVQDSTKAHQGRGDAFNTAIGILQLGLGIVL